MPFFCNYVVETGSHKVLYVFFYGAFVFHRSKKYRFGATEGGVIDHMIFVVVWTIPLNYFSLTVMLSNTNFNIGPKVVFQTEWRTSYLSPKAYLFPSAGLQSSWKWISLSIKITAQWVCNNNWPDVCWVFINGFNLECLHLSSHL